MSSSSSRPKRPTDIGTRRAASGGSTLVRTWTRGRNRWSSATSRWTSLARPAANLPEAGQPGRRGGATFATGRGIRLTTTLWSRPTLTSYGGGCRDLRLAGPWRDYVGCGRSISTAVAVLSACTGYAEVATIPTSRGPPIPSRCARCVALLAAPRHQSRHRRGPAHESHRSRVGAAVSAEPVIESRSLGRPPRQEDRTNLCVAGLSGPTVRTSGWPSPSRRRSDWQPFVSTIADRPPDDGGDRIAGGPA